MKTVHVFPRRNRRVNSSLVDGPGQGRLDENGVDARVLVQLFDQAEQFRLSGGRGQHSSLGKNSQTLRRLLLHAHVNSRGGIFTDANENEPRLCPSRFECGNSSGGFVMNLLGYGAAVDERGLRHQGRSSESISMTGTVGQRGSMNSSPVTMMRNPLYRSSLYSG